MENKDIVALVKNKLAITSEVRDDFIDAIVKGVKSELKDINGIDMSQDEDTYLTMYIVELSAWRYSANDGIVPPYLKLWLNNLIVRGLKNEKKDI